ncbi:hypothetical protein C8R47DRAFT_1164176 [Mycena vitilis]|nr:hypothetical protein C8R47DRAFT_1164176 [Mycena vitilis]
MELEAILSQLRIQQPQAQERLGSSEYPVLPDELISEIFLHTLPPYPDFPPRIGPSSPVLLTHICQSWRRIALGTPQLWSVISSLTDYDATHVKSEVRMFRLWLERSRFCPLHLRLGTFEAFASRELVEAVAPHRARLEYLMSNLHADDHHLFDGSMPLLRHLEFIVHEDKSPRHIVTLRDAPLLRTVVLNDDALSRVAIPWTQLTSLTLLRVFPSECTPILVQTPNLVHCKLHVCFRFDGAPNNPNPQDMLLPRLESLILSDPGGQPVTDFLHHFVAPALRILQVPEYFLAPDPIDTLSAFISRSGCVLEELHLTGTSEISEQACWQAFPSLRKISIS